ncbi:MAG: ABC transporter permease, partial [Spirochaetia bacterium]|nr:ABC transporter permease [Spirochaetia bacterium]
MNNSALLVSLGGVLASAAPVLFAVIGETISERAGVLNLSMNGMILLSAMGSFAVALSTGSVVLGFLAGALIGALVSLVVVFASLTLLQSQVAVGFVLALLCRDLSYFLGSPIMGQVGPRISQLPIPGLEQIPVLGTILFRQDMMTYLSFILVILAWFFIFKTRPGLTLRGIGERPAAAFVRGANVNRLRYLYAVLGGTIAGLAGPIYSLSVKAGWKGTISGLDGIGWIVLSITIFGGWKPFRAAFGAYLFAFLQWLGLVL